MANRPERMMKKEIIPARPGINSELIPYYCGRQDCVPNWSWGPGVRDHFIFHYIKSGKGTLKINKKTYEIGPESLFVIPPHEMASYQADAADPWSYLWIGFSGLNAQSFVMETGFGREDPVRSLANTPHTAQAIYACLDGMVEASESKVCATIKLTGLLYSFIAALIEANAARSAAPVAGDEKAKELYVRKAAEFVYMNYSREITVEDIAKHIGIGRKYLHSIFSELAGTSPSEFLINYRLHKACELMKDKTLQISDVAHSVGYPNPLNFTRIFHKVKGLSPKQYRERTNAYLGCQ
jgi:AraC-like DNA-binding protein